MSNNANIVFSTTGAPDGYCFTSFSRFWLDFAASLSGYLPGAYSTIIVSESEPAAEDRDKLWFKTLPGGAPGGKAFSYFMGKWVSPNPIEAEADERKWWVGSESDLWAYDGGDGTDPVGNPPTATTGAMWVRDTDFDFRFPLAMGTSPGGTTVVPGDTGGEEKHTLTQAETPLKSHFHLDGATTQSGDDGGVWFGKTVVATSKKVPPLGVGNSDKAHTSTESQDGDPHSTMPPYLVGMWAKRTIRQFFTA